MNRSNTEHGHRTMLSRVIGTAVWCGAGAGLGHAAAFPTDAATQEGPPQALGEAVRSYPEGLGGTSAVRELSDGRVLIADPAGEALIVWQTDGSADTLMNMGEGPSEYGSPIGLTELPDDHTLLTDFANGRLTLIAPDLSFTDSWPLAGTSTGGNTVSVSIRRPEGFDADGHIYYEERVGGMGSSSDSAQVTRWNLQSGTARAVANIGLPATTRTESGGRNNRNVSIQSIPYAPGDEWAVAPDGRVFLVRGPPYRVEWLYPDGRRIAGGPFDYEAVRIGGAERTEWLERSVMGTSVSATMDGGAPRFRFRQVETDLGAESDYDWPDEKPPFSGVWIDRTGRAWVQRHVAAGENLLFDVFDGEGRRIGQVEAPSERQLVGFGTEHIYLSRTDALGFGWLEAYEVPTF